MTSDIEITRIDPDDESQVEALLELGIERVVAGDEPRGAGTDAVALDRRNRGGLQVRMVGQSEIVVAGERKQPPAVAFDPEAVAAAGRHEAPPQMRLIEAVELAAREFVEGSHVALY